MTDICFEKAIQTLYEIQTAESLRLEEQTKNTEISFSEKFEKQMKKLIHRREKPYYVLINTAVKRVAVIILAAVITTVSATIGIAAVYQPFADFIMEIFDDHTLFRPNHNNQTSSVDPLAEWKVYTLSYIPEGFEVENEYEDWSEVYVKYSNSSGEFFAVKQLWYDDSTRIDIDTEGTVVEDISILGVNGIYYENKGEKIICFTYNSVFVILNGNIDKNELVNIAISLNLEEK